MAIENGRFKTRKEREEEEKRRQLESAGYIALPTYEEQRLIEEKAKEDAAMAASSEKGLDFLRKPSNFDDGYQFGDVTKSALGTLGDIGVGAVKGVMKMGEGIGDAAQYGAAALADLVGADDKAEKIRQNAQKEKVAAAFSGVDDYLDKYSVLGRTSDAAAESLGQIGAIVGTAGLAGALGAGAVGTTAATTGLMGLSSFGSGTGEAYAAGADEGEAEAYGAIAGAADALSEMIFGGLGKGFKALGLSKGITSADDVLAKAVTSKIRNTLAKNTVQLGIKAGAEGLEEVLAGTMQAAGKKMTYMSESDFADIIKDENLLEQFVVGAMASGISQTPSFVSATRAGVDLVSDGADAASDGAQDEQDKFSELRDKNADFGEIERTGLASGAKDEDIRMAGELSSALGKKIRFYREEAKDGTIRNGEYHEDTDTIYINAASKNVKSQIVAHELTHSIEKAGAYKSLVDTVFEKLRADGEDIDALYRKKEMLYAKADAKLGSYEEITSEIVAEFVEKRLLTDEKSIKSLVQENRSLGQKIKDWFDSVLAKMGNADAQSREYLRKMRNLYAEALGESKGTESGKGVKYSIKNTKTMKYADQVSRIEGKRMKSSDSLFIGTPDQKLQSVGLTSAPFVMNQSDYRKSRRTEGNNPHYSSHGVDKKFFDDIHKHLAEAPMVIENGDKMTIITDQPMKDRNGKRSYIIVGVQKNIDMDGDTVNLIRSVYPFDDIGERLSRSKENGTLKVIDKRKADEMFATINGIQSSAASNNIDFNDKSISHSRGNVKGDGTISEFGVEEISPENRIERGVGRKFSVSVDTEGRPLSDAQKEYFKKSKVVDENGNLKVVYHGSPVEFNEFSLEYLGTNGTAEGYGFYFTDKKSIAEGYSKGHEGQRDEGHNGKLFEVYLDIKKPLSDTEVTMSRAQFKKFLTELNKQKDEDGYPLDVLSNYGDVEWEGLNSVINTAMEIEYDGSDSDVNMVHSIINGVGNLETVLKVLRKTTGYDGIIVENATWGGDQTIYVAFHPEQIKNVDNLNPTSNPDIRYSVSKDDSDKRVMPKKSAAGTKARARQEQQARMQFEKKVMNRGFDKLSSVEQEHYREEIVGQYHRKYNDYKKKRDELISSGYQFDGVDDYVEKVVGSVEDAAIDANTFLIHYQEGVFGDPAREDVQEFAFDYLQMLGMQRPENRDIETDDPLAGVSSAVETEVEELDVPTPTDADAPASGYAENIDIPVVGDYKQTESGKSGQQKQGAGQMTRERASERMRARQEKREARQKIVHAETAFRRLGYKIAGAVSENYEDAAGIIEDTRLAAQANYDIEKYIENNNVKPTVDAAAKLIASGETKPTRSSTGLSGEQLKMAVELAEMYKQHTEISKNTVKAQGKDEAARITETYDKMLGGYDWFTDKGKRAKRLSSQLQLNLSNPEQVIRDAFGYAQEKYDIEKYIKDNNIGPTVDTVAKLIAAGESDITKTAAGLSSEQLKMAVNLADMYKQNAEIRKNEEMVKELNDYLIKPTIQNSAEARRQTNRQVAKLREYGLNESESGLTQLFAEYSTMKESGSKKALLDQSMLRGLLLGEKSAKDIAYRIALKEGEIEKTGKEGENGFTKSITDVIETAQKVVMKRAAERALRDYKEHGGTNASWNMLTKEQKQSKIDAAAEAIADESVGRIEEAAKEMRLLLDDMYDAINAISVIHGSQPIPFRRGYMPHSHRQTEAVQQWFNDHMGGINVTPVGDLPTDIAGKTADRKPNKRWMAHAQERTGPRTTWDAVGNIEEYLRIANDTIYHMDDIKKMRVLERYIRGIYSVARGETGETAKKKIKNDVLQRMYGAADDETLVFLGLKKNEKPVINDEDMDLSQMTPFVTWLTNYANDLAAKQIFNRDIEAVAGRKYNNIANTITSWSSRVMMQYNISSNLKQLSQVGTVAGDVGMTIAKDAAALAARSMRDLGNGTNDLEQKYHISERSTFLAEKQNIEEAAFASDHDLTEAQRAKRDKAAEIWDYAWSFTDTTMSRFAVYSYFLEGMKRGMNDTDSLAYADSKARNILASRMKGSSPLIFQSKNPILRLFTMFQREPLAAWEDVLKTMPREYAEYKEANGDKAAKEWITKRVTGRILGASMTNAAYLAIGLGTPAMFDILGAPLSAILEKVIGDLTEDEEDDQTWGEMLEGFGNNLKNEIADDIPFASLIAAITNTAAGTDFESRLPINAPDIDKLFAMFTAPADVVKLTAAIANADDAETIEALQEDRADVAKQIPFAMLSSILEIIGTAAPAGNQIRKSASGLIAVLRGGEYTSDGRLKYEVGGLDAVRAVTLGKSNTKAAQEWVEGGFGSYSESETEAYHALVSSGVSKSKAAKYVNAVTDAEKQGDETKAQAEARILDGLRGLNDDQRAELYYELVATDSQIKAIDAAINAGADRTDAVWAARSIRELSKRGEKVDALIASEMDAGAKRAVYDQMITDEDGDKIDALASVGLDFEDFLAAKSEQSRLNADESLTASKRATRFMAWIADQGYTDEQEQAVSDTFAFASGFKVQAKAYEDLVAAGVTADNAVLVTDALSGASRAIDKINAVWSTGLTGAQLDNAVKAVVTEGWYERYRKVVDANVPLDVLTWVLDNADANGNDSIDNEERTLILSQLALSRKELSALWEATGGSEKSNPYKSGSGADVKMPEIKMPEVKMPEIKMPEVKMPEIKMPEINVPYFGF